MHTKGKSCECNQNISMEKSIFAGGVHPSKSFSERSVDSSHSLWFMTHYISSWHSKEKIKVFGLMSWMENNLEGFQTLSIVERMTSLPIVLFACSLLIML